MGKTKIYYFYAPLKHSKKILNDWDFHQFVLTKTTDFEVTEKIWNDWMSYLKRENADYLTINPVGIGLMNDNDALEKIHIRMPSGDFLPVGTFSCIKERLDALSVAEALLDTNINIMVQL